MSQSVILIAITGPAKIGGSQGTSLDFFLRAVQCKLDETSP